MVAAGEQYAEAPDELPEHFTLVLAREYGMWRFERCRFEVHVGLSPSRARLSCELTGGGRIGAEQPLEPHWTLRLVELARASNLYGPDHIGADLTPGDGPFETLRVTPEGGGPTAVLVTTRNRSFVKSGPRRDLLEMLTRMETGLLKQAEKRSL